jgi:2-polyprenyl-3-methyl-5-hydroxy-6-metoxy-1,4-benzoquinol methylase
VPLTARNGDEFDTTSLTSGSHGYRVHRDYAAHFFRWGWVSRQLNPGMDVLEVGCGRDFPFIKVIEAYPTNLPRKYVGVDLNPLIKTPERKWTEIHGSFNFIQDHPSLSMFDRIICLEVIEHMRQVHGHDLLRAMAAHLKPAGRIYLSTPVFNGRAAKNHIHEYTVEELTDAINGAGLQVLRRFGTFASKRDLEKVATQQELALLDRIGEFYSSDVTACFLAPLYPDAARNNLWEIEHAA